MSGAPKNSAKLYLTNAASSVATRALQLTVLVWVNQNLLRRVDPSEYSLLPVVMSLVFFADVVRNIFVGGLSRFLVEADARGDDESMSRIVSSMLPVLAGLAALLAAAGALAAWRLDVLVKIDPGQLPEARWMLLLLIATMCVTVVAAPLANGLYIRQRFTTLNIVELGCEALRVAIVLSLLLGVSPRVLWLVVATSASTLVSTAIHVALTRRLLPAIRFRLELVSLATVRRLTGFGAWTSVQGIIGLVDNSAPALLLNRFGTALDVACFHLGSLPDKQFKRLAMAAALPAQPALTSVYATEGSTRFAQLYYRGGRYHLWILLAVLPVLGAFGTPIVQLYVGSEYASAATVMFLLLAAYPFEWASAMFYRVSYAAGDVKHFYLSMVVLRCVALAAMGYAVQIERSGAVGMAAALAASNALIHVLLVWPLGLRFIGGRWSRFLRETLLPGVLPAAVALPVGFAFESAVDVESWLQVMLGSSLALGVYVVVLLLLCLDDYDRQLLGRGLSRVRAKFARYGRVGQA